MSGASESARGGFHLRQDRAGNEAIKRWRESRYTLVLVWLGVFTLVVVLSDRTPHMLRGSGLVPAAYLTAMGLAGLWLAVRRLDRILID